MIWNDQKVQLLGHWFVANISLPENLSVGLVNVSRDPRKQRRKPACYVGVVEEVGPDCFLVKEGDRVIFERWEYKQQNIDEERIVAREDQLIILDGDKPAPNVMILELMEMDTLRTSLVVPQTILSNPKEYHVGKVVASAAGSENGIVGDVLYVEAYEQDQYHDGKGRLFFRVGPKADILMRITKTPEFQVV